MSGSSRSAVRLVDHGALEPARAGRAGRLGRHADGEPAAHAHPDAERAHVRERAGLVGQALRHPPQRRQPASGQARHEDDVAIRRDPIPEAPQRRVARGRRRVAARDPDGAGHHLAIAADHAVLAEEGRVRAAGGGRDGRQALELDLAHRPGPTIREHGADAVDQAPPVRRSARHLAARDEAEVRERPILAPGGEDDRLVHLLERIVAAGALDAPHATLLAILLEEGLEEVRARHGGDVDPRHDAGVGRRRGERLRRDARPRGPRHQEGRHRNQHGGEDQPPALSPQLAHARGW
ncbi:MAG: hypothetical protein M5U28_32460 [Sandaracinaceae bacterium]|nr:hypothetical protein [Sandaracinaceae bacterium]